jgi:hypothetical protein
MEVDYSVFFYLSSKKVELVDKVEFYVNISEKE